MCHVSTSAAITTMQSTRIDKIVCFDLDDMADQVRTPPGYDSDILHITITVTMTLPRDDLDGLPAAGHRPHVRSCVN